MERDAPKRWAGFTDRELDHVWQHLITPFVDPAYEDLVADLEAEQQARRSVVVETGEPA